MVFTIHSFYLIMMLYRAELIFEVVSSPINLDHEETGALELPRTISDGVAMRILPLGDSITWGSGSTQGNGYRLRLLTLLSENPVTYIGSQRSGSMVNNNNEGHPGAVISQIEEFASTSLPLRPNIILVLAGTNDVDRNIDLSHSPERLESLLDKLIGACPDAVVLVAKIPEIGDEVKNAVALAFNAAIPDIVDARAILGAKILTVDMSSVKNFTDSLHPNDLGYSQMADVWYGGIQEAAERGWIQEPIFVPQHNHTACGTFLEWNDRFGKIATGVGSGDSAFVSGWQPAGKLAAGGVGFSIEGGTVQSYGVRVADMDGDGRDDYLWVHPATGAATLYLNGGYKDGAIDWISKGQIATGIGESTGVMFADINGDGRDDYLWVSNDGEVTAYINGGEQTGGGWSWTSLGVIAGQGTGGSSTTTRFADINGDGRADYIVVGSDGSLNAWLNVGPGDKPEWYPLGIIATGIGRNLHDLEYIHLYDLNNDGRADYIFVGEDSSATAYINNRAGSKGLVPNWINVGNIAKGVGAPSYLVKFGDLDGDGKADYLRIYQDTGALDVWFNTGSGGAYLVGDGTRFADMDGDGLDDYLAVGPDGAIQLWRNHGYDTSAQKWNWEQQGQIATGVAQRKNIRFADLDGDGLADYLVVDEKSGAVVFWRNGGRQADGSWGWTNEGQVATGIGAGAGVQFADIDGDGMADYLWVAENGAVTAYLNGGRGSDGWIWNSQGIIATGVGASREDVQFYDIDGDGLADYLCVNHIDGSVSEWRNGGLTDKAWRWNPQGQIATGVGNNGLTIQFADLNGDGRAEYLSVDPDSGAVTMWVNDCFGESEGGNGWQNKQCSDPGIDDATLDPGTRWNAVDTTSAWVAALKQWNSNTLPGHLSFSQQMNMNFYNALFETETNMTTIMSSFASNFAPIKDTSTIAKQIIDFAGLGFGLVVSPVWNIGTLKDIVNSIISGSLTITKDTSIGGVKLSVQNNLEEAMSNLLAYWLKAMIALNDNLFSGSTSSLKSLTLLIKDGHVLNFIEKPGDNTIRDFIEQALFAWLIPKAWSLSNEGFYPVILDSGEACSDANPLDKYISDDTAKETSVCYEGHLYYFVSASGKYDDCRPNPGGDGCGDGTYFKTLPGMAALDAGTYGKVTKTDLVQGALAGYHANGNRNGWPVANPGDQATPDTLFAHGIHSPGVVMIPICSPEVAVDGWRKHNTKAPGYPCLDG
ncbi:FG-GAP repeat domain-containing protein [Rutstroemia sp. NJR-2017a BVV2]|nr:FG-GAP repeat domain-containing protein [Rutstroemia sp. NJR-2017a BVV2]